MPWKKQFDVDAALDQAQDLFWRQGYEATSMDDLLKAMGIHRASFYDTFGNKRKVYESVLDRYDERNRRELLKQLASGQPPREAVRTLFRAVRDEACSRGGTRGCFLANATLERAASDPGVARIVRRAYAESETFFRDAVLRGQAEGTIRKSVAADTVARALLGLLLGMRVLACAGTKPDVLDSILEQVDALL